MAGNKFLSISSGIANLIDFTNLKDGDTALILARDHIEWEVVRNLATQLRSRDISPSVMVIEEVDQARPPPKPVRQAMTGADAIYDIGRLLAHTRAGMRAIYDYGVKYMMLPDPSILDTPAATFPAELWYVIARKVQERVRAGGKFSVTDEKGTDFKMDIPPGGVGAYIGPETFNTGPAVPGYIGVFPFGSTPWGDLLDSAEGVLRLDVFHTYGAVDPYVEWTVEDGWIVDFGGDQVVQEVVDLIEGIPNANRLAEIGVPSNPKVPPWPSPDTPEERAAAVMLMVRRAGNLQLAMGSDALLGGKHTSSLQPLFGSILDPTICVGDEVLVDQGHLTVLDDPEVVEAAKRFGEPHELLSRAGGG